MQYLSGNKGVKNVPTGPVRMPLSRVKKKKSQRSEVDVFPWAEINPNQLDHEELRPDRRGEDQTKPHQPYEFKSWLKRHLISKWVYWLSLPPQ